MLVGKNLCLYFEFVVVVAVADRLPHAVGLRGQIPHRIVSIALGERGGGT